MSVIDIVPFMTHCFQDREKYFKIQPCVLRLGDKQCLFVGFVMLVPILIYINIHIVHGVLKSAA